MRVVWIKDWWINFYKLWSVQVAALGLLLPEILQLLADNSSVVPYFDEATKSFIRVVCLILVILLRGVKQNPKV